MTATSMTETIVAMDSANLVSPVPLSMWLANSAENMVAGVSDSTIVAPCVDVLNGRRN